MDRHRITRGGGSDRVFAQESRCPHCGSTRCQEARKDGSVVTFRCQHCWKIFLGKDEASLPAASDDAV
jgi:transposase-like protein